MYNVAAMNNTAIYKALIEVGVSPEIAARAVDALPSANELATKADIAEVKVDIAQLETTGCSVGTSSLLASSSPPWG